MFEDLLIKHFKISFLHSVDFSFPNKLFKFLTLTSNTCLHALFLNKKLRPSVVLRYSDDLKSLI